jgi:hypothetical protein
MLYTGTIAPTAAGNIIKSGKLVRSDGRDRGEVDPSGVQVPGQKFNSWSEAPKSTMHECSVISE